MTYYIVTYISICHINKDIIILIPEIIIEFFKCLYFGTYVEPNRTFAHENWLDLAQYQAVSEIFSGKNF